MTVGTPQVIADFPFTTGGTGTTTDDCPAGSLIVVVPYPNALGDTITAGHLIARGELVVPFDLTVPAADAFYVACRPSVRQAPIVKVFIDWLFASLEESLPEPQTSARMLLRGRGTRAAEPFRPIPAPVKRRTASTPQRKTRA